MEFTNRHSQRPKTGTPASANRPTSGLNHRPKSASPRPTTPQPTISGAFKFSAKIIKAAVRHTTKSVANEAKELIKLTEEEFDLDKNPRWQKIRSLIISIARKLRLPPKVFLIIVGILIAAIFALIINQVFFKHRSVELSGDRKNGVSKTGAPRFSSDEPTFKTLLPGGKSIKQLTGWKVIIQPDSSQAFNYPDTINGVGIHVVEQALPDKIADKVVEEAKTSSANEEVTAGETKAYLGTSAKGPQTLIFTKAGLLVIITSDGTISHEDWVSYVQNLG